MRRVGEDLCKTEVILTTSFHEVQILRVLRKEKCVRWCILLKGSPARVCEYGRNIPKNFLPTFSAPASNGNLHQTWIVIITEYFLRSTFVRFARICVIQFWYTHPIALSIILDDQGHRIGRCPRKIAESFWSKRSLLCSLWLNTDGFIGSH
jgi:hypothetical protein